MLMKEPRHSGTFAKWTKMGVTTFFIGELICCGYAYYIWRKMNRNQDYRYIMYQKSPSVLNAFYWTTAKMGHADVKEADYKEWGVHFNKKVERLY